jgi:diguanylate cyclase (GGDEF)-like protein
MTADVLDQSGRLGDGDGESAARWPVPDRETDRIVALHAYGVLDHESAADLDAAARLAAYVCGVPTAAINLIDTDRQWQAASFGVEPVESPREGALCAQVVAGADVVHAADASTDTRFSGGPLAVGRVTDVKLYAAAPLLTREGHAIGTLCVFDQTARRLSDEQLTLLADLAEQVMALFEMRRMATALARAASRDGVTGLPNRRSLEQAVAAAIARAERGLGTPSVVMIDLDDFQSLNDIYGHNAGDAVLRTVASQLTATARGVDTVARVGGDEFVVLLEHTGGPGAVAALGRLRTCLASLGVDSEGERMVGASLGMATYRPGDSVASLLSRADAEMFAEKSRR